MLHLRKGEDMQVVPLHVHTEYSLLDGAIRIKDYCKFAKENDMTAIAITDHGVMYGDLELYTTAKEYGLKPILGSEFYVHDGDITQQDKTDNPCYHLVLLAKNEKGYKNLIKLTSIAWCEGFYSKPRINWELIQKHHEGLICLSACLAGELLRYLKTGEKEKAYETAKKYKELFGEDYYIELQDHGLLEQKKTNPELIKIAKELDIKMVITNDSHYLRQEDADMHDTLLCLQTNSDKDAVNRFRFENDQFFVKTTDQLRESFKWMDLDLFEECIKNTNDIADKCHLIIELGKSPLPDYQVPPQYNIESYLEHLVKEGLEKRYGNISDELKKRVRYELDVINKMGFAAYFLITWDFIHYAKTHGIPVGPGRGSAAGSVVAYALEITDLDPIKHKLLFERFLNPERFTMPDIDIDFCYEKRGQVINYVIEKYGADKVCQIITFGTHAAKAAFKGIARILKIPFSESNRLSALIQPAIDLAMSIDEKAKTLGQAIKFEGSELRALYDKDEPIATDTPGKTVGFKKLIDLAIGVEGLKNSTGTHAAGVIIAPKPLDEILPIQPSKKNGIIQTGYPPHDVTEVLSLLKMDFLGLKNLTIIYKTVELVEKIKNIKININNISLEDKPVYEMLMEGKTEGVFQLESDGMRSLVKKLKPDVFEDLGALVALYRPGPLNSGMVDDFVERKHGRQAITYAHPLLEPVLKDTYGTIVYQEQIMQIFQVLADYTLGQADMVRRMMGKKKVDEMEQQRTKFIERSATHNMSAKDAEALFEQILSFASYCFNRSHSAAYAFVAYQTAYLKCHYPVEYMASLLSVFSAEKDKTQMYISCCQDMGISVLPPDINKSELEFSPDGENIRFGLISVKGLGEVAIKQIIEERNKNGDYKDIADFASRLDTKCVNRKTLECLSKAGAFDSFGVPRRQIFENIDNIINLCQKESSSKQTGQVSLFSSMDESFYKSSFRLEGEPVEFTDSEIQEFEKDILGFYVTSHPLSSIKDKLPFLTTHTIAKVLENPPPKTVTICGLLSGVRPIHYKSKPEQFLKVGVVEDLTGSIEFKMFYKELLPVNELVESGRKLIMTGTVETKDDKTDFTVNSVSAIENSNLVTLSFKKDLTFEQIVELKDDLVSFKGSDPVLLKLDNDGEEIKLLSSAVFWVDAKNEFAHAISNKYKNELEVEIKSLEA